MLTLRWAHLQRILAAALPPETLHLNCPCIGFTQAEDRVTVRFAVAPPVDADLLVGADGIHSVIRQILFAEGDPRAAGRRSWRAVIPQQPGWLPTDEATVIVGADGKTMVLTDAGDQSLFWSAGVRAAERTDAAEPAAVSARVWNAFRDWPAPVPAVIAATSPAAIVERPILDRPPLAQWSQGRVTLLGDAAHPMVPALGQGANTAFEDAAVLAQSLARSARVEAALAHYAASRIPRSQVIQARSAV